MQPKAVNPHIMMSTSILNLKAVYATLGCKLNFAETSTLAEQLAAYGIHRAEKGEHADLCVINTCAVTSMAETKCRQVIRRLIRNHPGAAVVVMGCYAQLSAAQLAKMDGVDLVLGSNEKANAAETIRQFVTNRAENENGTLAKESKSLCSKRIDTFMPSCSRGNRTRYFLKVQDGCNYYCTYCTIPFARGHSRNPDIASLVKQAEEVARRGGKEIVLTGVNIGHFGHGSSETFFDLVRALDNVEGIERYRISSIEPDLLDDALIDYCAESRSFMPHFHLPLQSGSDEVLRLMHRRYDTALFADKVAHIKAVMPDAFIGVDIMVGMRGETNALFQQSYEFINSLPVTQLHVFPYSERPGTAALRIPHIVPEEEKKERVRRLISVSESKRKQFYQSYIGENKKVLLESTVQGRFMHGFTENYIRVELPADDNTRKLDNEVIDVQLGQLNDDATALQAVIC